MMPVTQKAVGRYKFGEIIFKDYVVTRPNIGEGQYAWVYEVANKARKRALKVFKTRIDWESGQDRDEGRGVKAVKDIQSLYLMEIVDYGYTTEHDESCLLMEYVKETLEDCLNKKGGKLDEALACHYFTEILKGLKDLKTFGIIHRDIKPGNLFLFSNTIKIGDYGFARFTSGSSASMSGARGTPAYSAPEVFKERYSHPADWWSASVILYRMLTGQMPFAGETQASVMKSVMFNEPDYSIVPEKYRSFLKICFKKDPKERHKSVKEMMDVYAELDPLPIHRAKDHPPWTDPATGMEFVWVPEGCFQMGSSSSEAHDDEKPVHEVCVDGFWMGKYEVTQGQWKKIMGSNPSNFQSGDDFPVETVSWDDAQQYISKLKQLSDNSFSLPTEAQWEYAARSGGQDQIYTGGNDVDRVAWYGDNSGRKTHQVGTKAPNGLGIYDMSGNVGEWCEDLYDGNAYSKHGRNNPLITSGHSSRVNRGGCWIDIPWFVRTAHRGWNSADIRLSYLGFRLCLSRVRQ